MRKLLIGSLVCAVVAAMGAQVWLGSGAVPPPVGAGVAVATDDGSGRDIAPGAEAPGARTASAGTDARSTTSAAAPEPGRVRVAGGPSVRGRLLHRGAALADVPVLVFVGDRGSTPRIDATTTDGEGRFSFAMPQQDSFFFAAEGPQLPFCWWSGWQQRQDADQALGDLHVPPGGAVDGTLADRDGRPVAGATITAERAGHRRPPNAAAQPPRETTSGVHGTFCLEDLHPGRHRLRVRARGCSILDEEIEVEGGARVAVAIELQPTRRRTGFVLDWRGAPLAGARVACARGGQVATTDAAGWFSIDDYSVGDEVRVTASGHVAEWIDGMRFRDESDPVQLLRAVTLRGVVRGAGGAPTTVQVTAADHGDGVDPARPFELIGKPLPVSSDGTFAIEGLSPPITSCRRRRRASASPRRCASNCAATARSN